MCYYTITLDQSNSEGHVRALMITDAKDKEDAEKQFLLAYGPEYYNNLDIVEGIHVNNGFERLLTDHVKKYILKAKTKADNDHPLVSYQNMIKLAYAA